ncbi:MAG: hypothetical protein GYB58_14565 [Gammaproteobacteria bacterium]|nr:hypothetical protein [Gammaproteobacteria bacterium]
MKEKDFKNWQQRRKQGALRFTLVQGLLCWGIPMFIVMTFVVNDVFNDQGIIQWAQVLIAAVVWSIGGCLFGAFVWFITERQYQKELQKQGDTEHST